MKSVIGLLGAVLLPLAAEAVVNVEWVAPESYRDAYYSNMKSEKSRDIVLDDLQKFLVAEAAPYVQEGQTLTFRVTQLDLAGEFEPWSKQPDVRVIKDTYFASISLAYELADDKGNILRQGKADLTNNLLIAPELRYKDQIDPYLRSTLHNWLYATFK